MLQSRLSETEDDRKSEQDINDVFDDQSIATYDPMMLNKLPVR